MEKITVSKRRMYLQELALLSFIRRGECHEPIIKFNKPFYKLKCDNPWEPTPKPRQREIIPQMEILKP